MSIIQIIGIGKCKPIYEAHTLPNLFTRQTKFTAALQQYADSYTLSDIDEHWLFLRDRYSGYDWAKAGLLKNFEDNANAIGGRLSSKELIDLIAGGSYANLHSIRTWKSFNLDQFRKYEIEYDWSDVMNHKTITFSGLNVDTGYFEISAQFKFLWIAAALKDDKLKHLVSGLGVRSGK